MTQQIVQNLESGLTCRTKINANFTELYDSVGDIESRVFTIPSSLANAVVTTSGSVTSGTDCVSAFNAAAAAATAAGGGTILFPPGKYLANSVLNIPNNVRVYLDHATIYGNIDPALPVPKGHQFLTVFAACGVETDADYGTVGFATGDYYVSAPIPFAANTTLLAGGNTIPTLASQVGIVTPGSFIAITDGVSSSWHGINNEIAEVLSVNSTTITLKQPLRYGYSNATNSLSDFARTYKRAKNPPGNINMAAWPVAGFRRVVPHRNGSIDGVGTIINLQNHEGIGYGDYAIFVWCALNFQVSGAITTAGGKNFALDCQGLRFENLTMAENYATSSTPSPAFLVNGSNDISFISPRGCWPLFFEEHCVNIDIYDPDLNGDGAFLKIAAGARDVRCYGGSVRAGNNNPPLVLGNSDYEFGVTNVLIDGLTTIGGNAACAYYSRPLLDSHPSTPPAMIAAAEPYFRGEQVTLRDCNLTSTLNAGLDLFQQYQPVQASNVAVGNNISGAANIAPIGNGVSVKRNFDGMRTSFRSAAALPTFPAYFLGEEIENTTGGARWRASLYRRDIPTGHFSTTAVPVGTIANYAAGDVVQILITNGSFVTAQIAATTAGSPNVTITSTTGIAVGMAVTGENIPTGTTVLSITNATTFVMSDNAVYGLPASAGGIVTVGNIRREHVSVVASTDVPNSRINLTTAMPAGYTAVSATGGYIKQTRWV